MTDCLTLIKELITFYVKTNYEKYLEEHNIKVIPKCDLDKVVNELYTQNKEHLKTFIISSMKELLKNEYPGDLFIKNILIDIFRDDELCKTTIITEIDLYQKKLSTQ